jgi:urease accessory protein
MKDSLKQLILLQFIIPGFIMLLLAPHAYAHTGIGPHNGWMHGFMHPLAGLDHVLAMIAVGLWATQTGGRAVWVVPLTFVAVMVLGGFLGVTTPAFTFTTHGIAISLMILGILIVTALRLPLVVSAFLVGLFALGHGYVHGSEMPPNISALSYSAGFTLATVWLHLCGIGIALFIKKLGRIYWLRLTGIVVAGVGGYFWLAG